MKKLLALIFIASVTGIFSFYSCKKDTSCTGCYPIIRSIGLANRPPVANAGPDQTITLPVNTANLDGSASTDPDNNIVSYIWTKISGPSSFNITNANSVKTQATSLAEGAYLFELKVTDSDGLFSTDTVKITLVRGLQGNPNVVFFFRDPTGGLDAANISVIESFAPRIVLVKVQIAGYPDAEIEGVWNSNYSPWCPISSIYVDATAYGSFNLPPGTYSWVAKSVTTDLSGYPIPDSFRQYWGAGSHTAQGTITVNPGDNCIIQKMVFQ